ncbi:uncharacterized protein LOC134692542 [Mytilus trossulus]|uniref:uncharacterized protein LOC134692542 n=1 Tax=Mytilus trossulus TaxID=6551 RepID=UPI0030065532
MRVHVFGNSPSPSVANYCLRKAVCNHEGEEQCDNVCKYVKEHFYVDDGLLSSDSEKDIASLIKRTQERLMTGEWDDPLPEYLLNDWQVWKQSLKDLETLEIRRSFTETSLGDCSKCELHICSDASKDAIASVAYIRTFNDNGHSQLGFVLGKSKLAPNHGHTIPRLELCAAVLATELASFIQKTFEIPSSATYFYTDSQVVLGYLYNETRLFYVYVSNRVDRILKVSTKLQWNYVPTSYNPADHGTRPLEVNSLRQSEWLKVPNAFFESQNLSDSTLFEVIEPEVDKEVRSLVEVKKTFVKSSGLDISLFEHFSTWTSLVRGIAFLKRKASIWHKDATDGKNSKSCVTFMKESEELIIKEVQQDTYYNKIS